MSQAPALRLRAVEDGDEAALIALWHAAGVYRPWNDPVRDIAFARRDAHSTILAGFVGERLVASVMVGEDGHRGWLHYVAVAPDQRRRGHAAAMTAAAEAWLAARGIWKVQLLVRDGNADALAFYDALGYHDTRSICLQKIIEPAGRSP